MPSREPVRRPTVAPAEAPRLPAACRLFLHVTPGLEELAAAEIAQAVPDAARLATWQHFDERTSILEYRSPVDLGPWLRLGCVEDLFVLAARGRAVRGDRAGLQQLAGSIRYSRYWNSGLSVARRGRVRPIRTFRVIARMAGEHEFRRVDARMSIEHAIQERLPQSRPVQDGGDLEVWISIIGSEALVGIRVSSGKMRQHGGQAGTVSAALKPPMARALAVLSEPRPTDVVLDPCCGGGTLLLERARLMACARLIGGDLDPQSVGLARANLSGLRVKTEIEQWDAERLPLPDASVDVVLTNPPFGKQWKLADGRAFYEALLAQIARVLKPDGRLVMVTSQVEVVKGLLSNSRLGLRRGKQIPVLLRGEPATIFVVRKSHPSGGDRVK